MDLSVKAGPELRVLGLRGVDHLHRDTETRRVEAAVDGAHAARAETADDPVGTDPLRVTGAGRLYPPVYASDAHRGVRSSWDGAELGTWSEGRPAIRSSITVLRRSGTV